jgi:LysR family transcriptional regulator, benzoate and cis,cis-muconate-responsive activator of ben and cat genes
MELRHLRYFVAVAEELNFRKAAERLYVTRPALSKQIKDLEELIGARLLDRDTTRVNLTSAGSVFLVEAKSILDQVERAIQITQEAKQGKRGRLSIGGAGQITASFLPAALKEFRQLFPDVDVSFVEIHLAELHLAEQIQALTCGDIDIGFTCGSELEDYPHLSKELLVSAPNWIFVSQHSPLVGRKSLELEDLVDQTLLVVGKDDSSEHYQTTIQMFLNQGLPTPNCQFISGYESLLTMLAADQGVSLMPSSLNFLHTHQITGVPLVHTVTPPPFDFYAFWRSDESSVIVSNFLKLLKKYAPSSVSDEIP